MVLASKPKHSYIGWDFVRGTKAAPQGVVLDESRPLPSRSRHTSEFHPAFPNLNPKVPIVMFSGYRSILDEAIGRIDRWVVKGQSEPQDFLSAKLSARVPLLKLNHSLGAQRNSSPVTPFLGFRKRNG
jgi:hypothetical protein